jgi:hypothetical protein
VSEAVPCRRLSLSRAAVWLSRVGPGLDGCLRGLGPSRRPGDHRIVWSAVTQGTANAQNAPEEDLPNRSGSGTRNVPGSWSLAGTPIRSWSRGPTPWPRSVALFPGLEPDTGTGTAVGVTGRVVFQRNTGGSASPPFRRVTAPAYR